MKMCEWEYGNVVKLGVRVCGKGIGKSVRTCGKIGRLMGKKSERKQRSNVKNSNDRNI